jgi:ADP-heptose:LPS heptosyltransferase
MKRKVLLIRLDKIGDLVSTLPVDQSVLFNGFEVRWIISKGLGFIASSADPERYYYELDKQKVAQSRTQLRAILAEYQPEVVISFQAPWWISYELFCAKVPIRVGNFSQWHSFIFLNKGIRQKRSQSNQHEFHYNLDLVYEGLGPVEKRVEREDLVLKLKKTIISTQCLEMIGTKNYWVIHPGMAGSAKNWSTSNYIKLIKEYFLMNSKAQLHYKIVVTGTSMDEPWVAPLRSEFEFDPRVVFLQNKLSAIELLEVLGSSECVLAPSTGVLHLAASLGVPTIGLFSPIRVQSIIRWGARGEKTQNLSPNIKCPAAHHCLKFKCAQFDCMDQISITQVLNLIMNILNAKITV